MKPINPEKDTHDAHVRIRKQHQYCVKCGHELGIERCFYRFNPLNGSEEWNYKQHCWGWGRLFHPAYYYDWYGDRIYYWH